MTRQPRCRIREIGRDEWESCWRRVRQANLLQSWEYGAAKAVAENWAPLRFLVEDEEGGALALAQVLTRVWPVVGGAARLNRGPLLVDADPASAEGREVALRALAALLAESRRRRWWLFYVAPELEDGDASGGCLRALGLRPRAQVPWASARLSLALVEDALLASLNGKWRNLLRKAQKADLALHRHEGGGAGLNAVIACYRRAQRDKGFRGISDGLLRALAVQTGPSWHVWQYSLNPASAASHPSDLSGMLVCAMHGDTATYLVGYTNDVGRATNANYLMLWQAILDAKRAGCAWFDLGGLNANTPPGVAHFKRGVNGDIYSLAGEWRRNIL